MHKALRIALLAAVCAVFFGVATPSHGHGYIVRAIPEDRATLERAPARLQYWFSEDLEPEFSSVTVLDQNGNEIASGGVSDDDQSLMTVRLPTDLPDGAYIINLRPTFASDGHLVAESRVFFVGEAVGGVSGEAASDAAVTLEVVWRGLLYTSSTLLMGVFAVYTIVLVPAWGSSKYPAGLLPPRVMNRLHVIAGVAIAVTFVGNLFALVQQTMNLFEVGAWTAITGGMWQVVRVGSRFGDVFDARLIILAILTVFMALSLYWRKTQPESVRAFWTASMWAGALFMGTFSVASHAAGSLILPWVAVIVDFVHVLAVGLWVGGLAALVLVLPVALHPYDEDRRRMALLAALRRFSRLALGSAAVVTATGVYNALNWFYDADDLQSTYGVALGVKLALVASLLAVGGMHHITLNADRYRRWRALTRRVETFIPTLRLEAALSLALLVAVGLLTATPVPEPDFISRDVETPTERRQLDDLALTMTISPGGTGINSYDAQFVLNDAGADTLNVSVQQVNPGRDWRSAWQSAEGVGDGLYVVAGDDIDRAGRWWTLVNYTTPDGETRRAAFEWMISENAAVIDSLPPGLLNWLAMVGVLGAVIFGFRAPLRRAYTLADWNTTNVAIVVGTVVVTVGALVVGYNTLANARADYAESLNPTPEIVNTVLPNQASLDRGRDLYIDHCIAWQAIPADFNALVDRVPRIRDEDLYTITVEGWADLPPCDGTLTETERWDIVNFFRTLADA